MLSPTELIFHEPNKDALRLLFLEALETLLLLPLHRGVEVFELLLLSGSVYLLQPLQGRLGSDGLCASSSFGFS